MFEKLGVQLYTIRDYMQDPEFADLAFKRLAELGYTEAHTAGNAFDEKLFSDLLAKHGISIIGTHYDYKKILEAPEETMEIHRMWGTTNVGIGGMPSAARKDLDELKRFIAEFNKAAELYASYGLIWPMFYTAVFYLAFVGLLTLLFGYIEKKLSYYRV